MGQIKQYFLNITPKKIIILIGMLSLVVPICVIASDIGTCAIVGLYGTLMSFMIGVFLYFRIRRKSLSKYLRYILLGVGLACMDFTVNLVYVQKIGLLNFNVAFMALTALGGWCLLVAGLDYLKRYKSGKDLNQLFLTIICFGHGIPLTLLSSFLISIGIMTSI